MQDMFRIFAVKGDTFYKFSCWIKTEDVLEDSKGANLSVLNTLTTSRSVTGTSKNWEYVELYGKTSPDQNIVSLSLALGGHGSLSSGKAWFDTVEAVEIDEVPAGEIALNLDPNNLSRSNDTNESGNNPLFKILLILIPIVILSYVAFIFYKSKKYSENNEAKNTSSNNVKNAKNAKNAKKSKKDTPSEEYKIFKVSFIKKTL